METVALRWQSFPFFRVLDNAKIAKHFQKPRDLLWSKMALVLFWLNLEIQLM
jgi:hypothetical protein